jgi:hypothetical protein
LFVFERKTLANSAPWEDEESRKALRTLNFSVPRSQTFPLPASVRAHETVPWLPAEPLASVPRARRVSAELPQFVIATPGAAEISSPEAVLNGFDAKAVVVTSTVIHATADVTVAVTVALSSALAGVLESGRVAVSAKSKTLRRRRPRE